MTPPRRGSAEFLLVAQCLCVIAVMCFEVSSRSEIAHFQYDSHGKRDPFAPLVGQEKPSIVKLEDISTVDDIKLEGMATGARGSLVAIMNGEIVKEADRYGSLEIKRIAKDSVTISLGGKEHTVMLPEEGGHKGE